MSTKIYNGMKIQAIDIPRFITWYRGVTFKHVKAKLSEFAETFTQKEMNTFLKTAYNLTPKQIRDNINRNPKYYVNVSYRMALALCFDSSLRGYSTPNFDCWANIHLKNKNYALVNVGLPSGMGITKHPKFNKEGFQTSIGRPKFVQEYSYWDNSDQPENISDKEWLARKRDWDAHTDDHNRYRLSHVVLECSNANLIGYPELLKKIPVEGPVAHVAYALAKNRLRKAK